MSTKGNCKRIFRGRSLQGCLTCKDRHIKCDEGRPICQNCIKVNRECVQRNGSRALPSSMSSDATAADAPNTTPAEPWVAETTIEDLGVVTENSKTSETEEAINTISNTGSETLSKYKESEINSTDHVHDINILTQNIHELDQPRTPIMDKKSPSKVKPATSASSVDKNAPKSTTTSNSNSPKMNGTENFFPPASGPKFVTPLSLASTTTNRLPSATLTPLRPIYHWVPPRPTIIARTDLSAAEIADLCAGDAARKAEKEKEKKERREQVEMMSVRAREVQMQMRAQELGGQRDCPFGICEESAAGCVKCKDMRVGGSG